MSLFQYKNLKAYCEEVPLEELAEKYGTPLYFYSGSYLKKRCHDLISAFRDYPTQPCYAVKANGNLTILKSIFSSGFGADVVSIGELERALLAGAKPECIVFSGVGKTDEEIERAINVGIFALQVESVCELEAIDRVASRLSRKARIALRINPDINVKTHPHIATGLYETKFGIPECDLEQAISTIRSHSSLDLIGLSCHIGSQIHELEPYQQAVSRMVQVAQGLQKQGFHLEALNIGGGYAVGYEGEVVPPIADYAKTLIGGVVGTGLKLMIEPGRWVVAESGAILTRVITRKQTPKKSFIIVDAAMTELIRPSLYDAFHGIHAVKQATLVAEAVDIVGPVCESGDFLGKDRRLPETQVGDLLILSHAGAYGSSMGSHYNSRPKPCEVLIDGKEAKLIRKRELLTNLWQLEQI